MSQRDDIICPQVATDVIEELCYEMGLQRAEALDEYAVFLVTQRGNERRPPCSTITMTTLDIFAFDRG